MNDSRTRLIQEFADREYREAYAEDFMNTSIATQIAVVREQRGLTQGQLGALVDMHQEAISRVENVHYGRWNIQTLRRIAFALDARLRVSLETYGSLVDDAISFSRESLQRVAFEDDPVFRDAGVVDTAVAADAGPAAEMRTAIEAWLSAGGDLQQLAHWLQGRDLPAVGHDEEPYRWLLRGATSAATRTGLAARAASMIGELREWMGRATRPGQLASNLLLLAAGLKQPDKVAEPLWRVYSSLASGEIALNEDSRDCLAAALTRNQVDARMEPVWMDTLADGSHPTLPGDEFTAIEGLKQQQSAPNVAAIGSALKQVQNRIYSDLQRAGRFRPIDAYEKFRSITVALAEAFSDYAALGDELLEAAWENGWSDWACAAWSKVFGSAARGEAGSFRSAEIASDAVIGARPAVSRPDERERPPQPAAPPPADQVQTAARGIRVQGSMLASDLDHAREAVDAELPVPAWPRLAWELPSSPAPYRPAT